MATVLTQLADNEGARKRRMRVGRGIGSGKGKTCGRGGKGQTARSGVAIRGFEGGQTPIHRRLPKRGFTNPTRIEYEVVNLADIQTATDAGKLSGAINRDALIQAGLVKGRRDGIKLLGNGKVTAKVTIEVDAASESAIAAVEKAGGKVSVLRQKQ